MEGKATKKDMMKNWVASYLGNFVGSLFLAFLVFKLGTLGAAPGAVNMAMAKCSMPFDVAFVRGILCNGCSTMVGKMTAVWFPISAFVALGLDHSVANMFMIPLAMLRGAEITVSQMFLKNIIPVTLGSIVGGSLCVMMPFGTTFGKWFDKKE
jgi:formate/nitrite transporter FocA (FNT family)